MDRKTFLKSVAVLGAMPSVIVVAKSKSSDTEKTSVPSFSSKRIFKVGKNNIVVDAPQEYADRLSDIYVSAVCGDGCFDAQSQNFGWCKSFPVESKIENGKLLLSVDFAEESLYSLIFRDRTKSDKRKRDADIISSLPVYALKPDLYALRPYKGDSHIHTTNSDGNASPEKVALRCYEIGLDYQAISDHKVYATSEDMKKKFSVYPSSMKFFNAEECHYSHIHVQNFGGGQSLTDYVKNNKAEFDSAVAKITGTLPREMPDSIKKAIAIAEAEFDLIRKFGGIAVFNHPYWEASKKAARFTYLPEAVISGLTERKKFDAYELVNGTCKEIALAKAAVHHSRNCPEKPVIGCTDAHSTSAQGCGYTVVFAKNDSFAEIKKAILKGNSVAVAQYKNKPMQNMAFGDLRLVNFAYFLFAEYFPQHDTIVAKQGELLKKAILDSQPADTDTLSKLSAEVRGLYPSLLA